MVVYAANLDSIFTKLINPVYLIVQLVISLTKLISYAKPVIQVVIDVTEKIVLNAKPAP